MGKAADRSQLDCNIMDTNPSSTIRWFHVYLRQEIQGRNAQSKRRQRGHSAKMIENDLIETPCMQGHRIAHDSVTYNEHLPVVLRTVL